jgi:hypothetical protein
MHHYKVYTRIPALWPVKIQEDILSSTCRKRIDIPRNEKSVNQLPMLVLGQFFDSEISVHNEVYL